MLVYVLNKDNTPLMPCKPIIARLLLKSGKAKVKRKTPFTIKLTKQIENPQVQELTLGVDTGSGTIGTAVSDEDGDIVYLSKVIVRNDIKTRMDRRRKYRRSRRNRKTRYRKARWLNRGNSIRKDRFSLTMISKIHSHIKEIEYIKSILPIKTIVLETGTFDTHLMKNPLLANEKIKHWGYQKGLNYGFENTKAKVLNRDKYTCQHCKGKHKDSKLEVHHIVFRSNGGSDEEDNLITLCHTCHSNLHEGNIKLNLKGKLKGTLSYATQMNSIRIQLLKYYPEAIETFGYITKQNRFNLNIDKDHDIDACVIATGGNKFNIKTPTIIKRDINKGDYQQTKGVRSQMKIPTGKIMGFRKFDKIQYLGKQYFIKGRESTGYGILMNIDGTKIKFNKCVKLKDCKRIISRTTQLLERRKPNSSAT